MLHFDQRHHEGTTLLYEGHIDHVLKGRVPLGAEKRWIHAEQFSYGFMGGSPHGLTSVGELFVVGGTAYAKSTDLTDHRYYSVIHGPRFVSLAFAGLSPNTDPSWTTEWQAPRGQQMTMTNFYRQVYEKVCRPFAFSALVSFGKMHGTALSLPPIYEELVFEDRARYWAFPPTIEEGGMGVLFGVVADFNDKRHEQLSKELQLAIYHNPFDSSAQLDAHCHALLLDQKLPAVGDLTHDMVDDVLHLLSDSTLTAVQAEIYPIERTKLL